MIFDAPGLLAVIGGRRNPVGCACQPPRSEWRARRVLPRGPRTLCPLCAALAALPWQTVARGAHSTPPSALPPAVRMLRPLRPTSTVTVRGDSAGAWRTSVPAGPAKLAAALSPGVMHAVASRQTCSGAVLPAEGRVIATAVVPTHIAMTVTKSCIMRAAMRTVTAAMALVARVALRTATATAGHIRAPVV